MDRDYERFLKRGYHKMVNDSALKLKSVNTKVPEVILNMSEIQNNRKDMISRIMHKNRGWEQNIKKVQRKRMSQYDSMQDVNNRSMLKFKKSIDNTPLPYIQTKQSEVVCETYRSLRDFEDKINT